MERSDKTPRKKQRVSLSWQSEKVARPPVPYDLHGFRVLASGVSVLSFLGPQDGREELSSGARAGHVPRLRRRSAAQLVPGGGWSRTLWVRRLRLRALGDYRAWPFGSSGRR